MNSKLVLLAGLAGVLLGGPVAGLQAEIRRDIEYGSEGGERLLLDVNVPEGTGPFPIAILVHGGGWTGGDKSGGAKPNDGADITPWFAPLTAAKFTWFSINYRLAPQHRWPAQFEDVKTAIRWVKAHGAEFKGDPARIAIFGHSSGGHLVTLAATEKNPDVRVQAVVGFAAVTDLEADLERRGGVSGVLKSFFGRVEEMNPESRATLRELSPINHVHAGIPPVLLVHGDADKSVPLAQSLAFQSRLKGAGVPCDLIVLPGAPHRLTEWEKSDPDHAHRWIDWLQRTLARGTPEAAHPSPTVSP
ncbi:MAG TPA: alpha/beta hydrolase [Opitutaceae bacterium]|nr:alpha/beta hydrolase [Opitutaceae bacterium]